MNEKSDELSLSFSDDRVDRVVFIVEFDKLKFVGQEVLTDDRVSTTK